MTEVFKIDLPAYEEYRSYSDCESDSESESESDSDSDSESGESENAREFDDRNWYEMERTYSALKREQGEFDLKELIEDKRLTFIQSHKVITEWTKTKDNNGH